MNRTGLIIALVIAAVVGAVFALDPALDLAIARPFHAINAGGNLFGLRISAPLMLLRDSMLWFVTLVAFVPGGALLIKLLRPTRPMLMWDTAWRALRDAAGLPRFRFHDLRHTVITELAERDDVAVAPPVNTGYELDRVASEAKLRVVTLEYDVKTQLVDGVLKVQVTGTFIERKGDKRLTPRTMGMDQRADSASTAIERDLTLRISQRLAAEMFKAKSPTPVTPPTSTPSPRTGACNCAPGDPLCSCL